MLRTHAERLDAKCKVFCCLSQKLYFRAASRFGSTPSAITIASFKAKLAKLKKRYRQKQPISPPDSYPRDSIQEYTGIFLPQR
jgi:hypothetical protein